jgi:membrane-associated phospholipid phosphatase
MESLLQWGINIVLFLQSLGEWLVTPMSLISSLGNEQFYLFAAPVVYWCVDASLGLRLGLGLMISGAFNHALKLAFHGPRPYWYSAKVRAFGTETSFGAPSGHSQHTVVVFGGIAAWLKRPWGWVTAILIVVLIGLSRIYLGLHFPHDVLLGWLAGALMLWGLLIMEKPVLARLNRMVPAEQALAAFGFSLFLILLGAAAAMALTVRNWTLPTEWIRLAAQATPVSTQINPMALSPLISNAGTFFGLALGAIWLKKRGGFEVHGTPKQYLARFVVGVIGVFLIWDGLGSIFPRGEAIYFYLLRYFRYALVGLWVSALAPMLFLKLGLAKPSHY